MTANEQKMRGDYITSKSRIKKTTESDLFDIVDSGMRGYIPLTSNMKYRIIPFTLTQLIQLEENGLIYETRSVNDSTFIKKLGDIEKVFNVRLPEVDSVKIHPEQDKIVNIEELADHYAEREYVEKYGSDMVDSKTFKELIEKHKQIINQFKVTNNE